MQGVLGDEGAGRRAKAISVKKGVFLIFSTTKGQLDAKRVLLTAKRISCQPSARKLMKPLHQAGSFLIC